MRLAQLVLEWLPTAESGTASTNTLFHGRPHGVAGLIRHRRLERCHRDLLDPLLADRSVHAIAARWGLTDAGHFSRAFRDTYGLPPGTYGRLRRP